MEHHGCRSSNAANKKKFIATTSAALQLQPPGRPSLYRALKMEWPAATGSRVPTPYRLQHASSIHLDASHDKASDVMSGVH
uniref:Uncharacterized protein n=1 Tax=Steinernema glaseri TaxID=37863 RepID=A0A1I7ZQP0_9BILA